MLMRLCVSIGIVDDSNLIYTLCSFKGFLKEMVLLFLIRKSKKYHKTVFVSLVVKCWRPAEEETLWSPHPGIHTTLLAVSSLLSSVRGLPRGLFQIVVFRVKCGQCGFRGDCEQESSFLVQRLCHRRLRCVLSCPSFLQPRALAV